MIDNYFYIIPGIPPPPIGGIGVGFSSGMSEITHSVVKSIPATEAAFSNANSNNFSRINYSSFI